MVGVTYSDRSSMFKSSPNVRSAMTSKVVKL